MVNIFKKVCAIESNDAVRFDSITADRIKENTEYEGIRLKVTGYLDKSRYVLQFDIGFGDVVVPKPVAMDYPSLLDMDHLKINAYTPFPYPDKRYHKTCYNKGFIYSLSCFSILGYINQPARAFTRPDGLGKRGLSQRLTCFAGP